MEKSVLEYVIRACEKELGKKGITDDYRNRLFILKEKAQEMLKLDFM